MGRFIYIILLLFSACDYGYDIAGMLNKGFSSNANLASLSLTTTEALTLAPTFAPGTTDYTLVLPFSVESIHVTAVSEDPKATLWSQFQLETPNSMVSGTSSGSQPLSVGENVLTITVKAQDGKNTRVYTIKLNRSAALSKELISFNLQNPPVIGTISGNDINLNVPFGANPTALVPEFITTGTSVTVETNLQTSGTTLQDFSSPITYRVHAADGSFQDYTVTVTVLPNSAKSLTSFGFTSPSSAGSFMGTNIFLTVPHGTNLTSLVADFTTTGESVLLDAIPQISGTTANDFSSVVSYRVIAADGSYQDYLVTVTALLNSSKTMSSFNFTSPASSGIIAGTAVTVPVPFGTNLTALVPQVTIVGSSVSPASGIPQNFTTPVVYTITAADGSTQVYEVTVVPAKSSNGDLASLTLDFLGITYDQTILVPGTLIEKSVAYDVSQVSLSALLSDTTASLVDGLGLNLPLTVGLNTFVIHTQSQIGLQKTYTLQITRAANPAKSIISFFLVSPSVSSTINQGLRTISLTAPFGTTPTALVASFSAPGASVKVGSTSQVSGTTPNDFTNPVTYTVTAADNTFQDYLVTVQVAANDSKTLDSFSFLSPNVAGIINESTKTISVTVPYSTDRSSLTANFTTSGANVKVGGTLQASGTTSNDFTVPVVYRVTANDASFEDYTVTVALAPASTNADLASLSMDFELIDYDVVLSSPGTSVIKSIPYEKAYVNLIGTLEDETASIITNLNTPFPLAVGLNSITITTQAQSTTQKTYTLNITRAPNPIKTITAFNFTSPSVTGAINEVAKTIGLTVPYGTVLTALVPTISISGASISPATNVAQNFNTPVTYTVTAADGTTQVYTVTVTSLLNPAKTIETFNFASPSVTGVINESGKTISLTVPYGTVLTALVPTITLTGASVSPASGVAKDFTNSVNYTVTAADGSQQVYIVTVTISSAENSNATLSSVSLSPMVLSPIFVPTSLSYQTQLVQNTPASFSFTKTQSISTVEYRINSGTWTPAVSGTSINTDTIGTQNLYLRVVSFDTLVTNTYIFQITVMGSFSVSPSQVTLPPSVSYTIDVTGPPGNYTFSKISGNGILVGSTTTSMTVTGASSADTSIYYVTDGTSGAYVSVYTKSYPDFDPKEIGLNVGATINVIPTGSNTFQVLKYSISQTGSFISFAEKRTDGFKLTGLASGTAYVSMTNTNGEQFIVKVIVANKPIGLSPLIVKGGTSVILTPTSTTGSPNFRMWFAGAPPSGKGITLNGGVPIDQGNAISGPFTLSSNAGVDTWVWFGVDDLNDGNGYDSFQIHIVP